MAKRTKPPRKAAVILSGGGARGAYQVGVLKALQARGIEPDIYCGTSVGAFNACMLGSGRSLEEVEELWSTLRRSDVFRLRFDPRSLLTLDPSVPLAMAVDSTRIVLNFLTNTMREDGAWWRAVDLDALLLDTSPLESLIRRNVNLQALRQSRKKVYIVLTRLRPAGGNPVTVVDTPHITHNHIHASCALPLIFPSVAFEEHVFCDGGVVMNTPLSIAIDEGAEEIYVVNLTPAPPDYLHATLPLAYQTLSASFAAAIEHDLKIARERNAEFLAALKEGRLVDGKLEVKKIREREGKFEEHVSRYSYVHLHEIAPRPDPRGIAAFLDFDPKVEKEWIAEGQREAEKVLSQHREHELLTRMDRG